MKREQKYPDTKTFKYFNANPKGRITGDCVFRAFSTAMNQDYNETVMEMAELMCQTGYALNDKKGEEAYLKKKGWKKHKQPRKADNTKYTGEEFCQLLQEKNDHRKIVCHVGGHHMVAIIDGKINDIWDSTYGCVGNYWTKE